MIGWGIMFILIGVGSFVLPMMDRQFVLITLFNELFGSEIVTAVVFIVVGLALIIFGSKGKANSDS